MRKALVIAVILTVLAAPAFANLLVNGGFSNGLTGWTVYTNTTLNLPYCTVYMGSAGPALELIAQDPTGWPGGFGCNITVYQTFNVVSGQSYTFSGSWQTPYPNQYVTTKFFFGNYTPSQVESGTGAFMSGSGGPFPGPVLNTMHSTSTSAIVAISLTYAASKTTVWADGTPFTLISNMSVVPNVPEPGCLLALGSGLVGLVGFAVRRRK